jgi:hypothetical protein
VKAATIGICMLADYSVWLKYCQHSAVCTIVMTAVLKVTSGLGSSLD